MAQGMGVAGELVEAPAEVGPAIARAFAADAPRVVEIVISRKP
jgi:thiamine pyrophosphate-dependent acetolactate synthase large subunit-like protein